MRLIRWLLRHWLSACAVIVGTPVLLNLWLSLGLVITFYTRLPWILVAAGCSVGIRHAVTAWIWTGRRRLQLARASLPAPSLGGMLSDWWQEKTRAAYVRKQWEVACLANGIVSKWKTTPNLYPVRPRWWKLPNLLSTIEGDLQFFVAPHALGLSVDAISKAAPIIAETCKARELLVRRIDIGEAHLTFLWTEVLDRVLPIADMPKAPTGRVAYGVRRDGSAASIPLAYHDLLGGMTGSGKSGDAWARLGYLNWQNIPYRPYVSNLKGGAELKAFADKVGQGQGPLTVAAYVSNVPDTIKMIAEFEKQMKARAAVFPYREWTVEHASEFPLCPLILDESVELMMKMDTKQRAILDTCLSQGRAQGFVVWMLSQQGQVEILKHTRNYLPSRRSLAQRDAVSTNMFLGDGAEQNGAPCSKIVDRPGLGYSYDETTRGYELFRSAWVSDDDMERIARGLVPEGMGRSKVPENRQTAVYRLYTRERVLLRVGHTNSPERRFAEYAKEAPWWPQVVLHPGDVVWAPTLEAAVEEENRAIRSELPVHNDQHNTKNPMRRPWTDTHIYDRKSHPDPANVTPIRNRPVEPAPARTRRRRSA